MPQVTDLNVRPYFDDYNVDNNFHRILFRPGVSIQTRELNQLQSILQLQLERFGNFRFKQGSQIVPGEININNKLNYVKISSVSQVRITSNDNEIVISFDVQSLKGRKLRGLNSGVIASLIEIQEATNESSLTLFVNYESSGFSNIDKTFRDGEVLEVVDGINTPTFTVATDSNAQPNFLSIDGQNVPSPAIGFATAAKIERGIYFVNGFFVRNEEQLIIIDPFYDKPSSKIGFLVNEEIVTENENPELYDNSLGTTNYTAPGAHRLAIDLKLESFATGEKTPKSFIEIISIKNGNLETKRTRDQGPEIPSYTGNFVKDQFFINLNNEQIEVGPGTAIIDGKEVTNSVLRKFAIEKARDKFETKNKTVNIEPLPYFDVNNIFNTIPLNKEGSFLTPYPDTIFHLKKNTSRKDVTIDQAYKTITVHLREPLTLSEREDFDIKELWYSVSEARNNKVEVTAFKFIEDIVGSTLVNKVQLEVFGIANHLESFLIDYNESISDKKRYLFLDDESASSLSPATDGYYGYIVDYSPLTFPIIGRGKFNNIKLLRKDNNFNPNIDKIISQPGAAFRLNYFDPKFLTKITLQEELPASNNDFDRTQGSYIYSQDKKTFGTIEKVISNKILLVNEIQGQFKQSQIIQDIEGRIARIATDNTISHIILHINGTGYSNTSTTTIVNDLEITSDKIDYIWNLDNLVGVKIKNHLIQYDSIPRIAIESGANKNARADIILHKNSVIRYNANDVKSLSCRFGIADQSSFYSDVLFEKLELIENFSGDANSKIISTTSNNLKNLRIDSIIEYTDNDSKLKTNIIKSYTKSEIILDSPLDAAIQNTNVLCSKRTEVRAINSSIYPTNSRRTAQIYSRDNANNVKHYFKKDFVTNASSSGSIVTFTTRLDLEINKFADFNESNFILTVLDAKDATEVKTGDIIFVQPSRIRLDTNTAGSLSGALSVDFPINYFGTIDSGKEFPILKLTATLFSENSIPRIKTAVKNKRIIISSYGDQVILFRGTDYDSNENAVLSYSDVYRLKYVYEGTPSQPPDVSVDGLLLSEFNKDVTHKYIFDSGQRDTFYDISRLILRPNEEAPKGQLVIGFDYFDHSTGDYCTVDSYLHEAGITNEEEIPSFNSTVYGKVELANVIDFRPKVDSTSKFPGYNKSLLFEGSSSFANDGAVIPATPAVFDEHIPFSIKYDEIQYLDRIDGLFLNTEGQFVLRQGNSSLNPSKPLLPNNSIDLYYFYIPAFTKFIDDIKIIKPTNDQYTMQDIGKLEKRVERLEYYTSLSVLEQQALNTQIQDDLGFDRHKVGFVVDNFEEHRLGNFNSEEYNCSIDTKQSVLKPEVYETSIKLKEDQELGVHYKRTGPVATLPYRSTRAISNIFSSKSVKPNPFISIQYIGEGKLTPEINHWFDEKRKPLINNTNTNIYSALLAKVKHGLSTIYDSYLVNWLGVDSSIFTSSINDVGSVNSDNLSSTNKTASTNSSSNISPQNNAVGKGIEVKTVGTKSISNSIQFYIQRHEIYFVVTRLKPNTEHFIFIDETNIKNWVNPDERFTGIPGNSLTRFSNKLISDDNGNLSGLIIFPNGHSPLENSRWFGDVDELEYDERSPETYIISGIKSFIFTSDEILKDKAESYVDLTYYSVGLLPNNPSSITATVPAKEKKHENIQLATSGEQSRPNPMAQVFSIQNYNGGIFLTDIDLYFSKKSQSLPIKIYISDTKDDLPTKYIIPRSEVILNPNTRLKVIANNRLALRQNEEIRGRISGASGPLTYILDANNNRVKVNSRNELTLIANEPYTLILETHNGKTFIEREDLDIPSVNQFNAQTAGRSKVSIVPNSGKISNLYIESTGSGYQNGLISIDSPLSVDSIRAAGTVRIDNGIFYDVQLTRPGRGYTEPPGVIANGVGFRPVGANVVSEVDYDTPSVIMGVAVSTETTDIPTKFTFDSPIYLQNNKKYALIIETDSSDYEVLASELGQLDKNTRLTITENPSLSSLYHSQNVDTWKENIFESLKINIYNATFDISKTGEIYLSNTDLGFETLDINPFESSSASNINSNTDLYGGNNKILRVHHKNHGFESSGKSHVFFSGARDVAGISDLTINTKLFEVSNVGIDTYNILSPEQAAQSTFSGGDTIIASYNRKYETLYAQIGSIELNDTDIQSYVKTTNIIPIDNNDLIDTYDNYDQSPYEQTFLNEPHYFSNQKVVTSKINSILNNIEKNRSLTYKLELKSNVDYLSPVIDIANASVKLQTNRIENATGKEDRFGIRDQDIVLYPVYKISASHTDENFYKISITGSESQAKGEIVEVVKNATNNLTGEIIVKVTSENPFENGENLLSDDDTFVDPDNNPIQVGTIPQKIDFPFTVRQRINARHPSKRDIIYVNNITGVVNTVNRFEDRIIVTQTNKKNISNLRAETNELQEKDIFKINDILEYAGQSPTKTLFWEVKEVKEKEGILYNPSNGFIKDSNIWVWSTKEISINQVSADTLTVKITAKIGNKGDLEVYYKTKNENSQELFDNIKWIKMEDDNIYDSKASSRYNVNETSDEYKELTFEVSNINPFTSFANKLVLRGDDPTILPKIQDIRSIASI